MRIVGFTVEPKSLSYGSACLEGNNHGAMRLSLDEPINLSYSVTIEMSKDTWPHRLDHYLNFGDSRLEVESLLLGLLVLIMATGLLSCTCLLYTSDAADE